MSVEKSTKAVPDLSSEGATELIGSAPKLVGAGDTVLRVISKYGTVIVLVGLIIGFSAAKPDLFPTSTNFVNIMSGVAVTAVISCGLTIALVAGVFDLSIGYVASFAGVLVTGLMSNQHLGIIPAILISLLVCGGIGLVNGLVVTKAGVNSFVATLGVGTIVIGMTFAYSSGIPVSMGVPPSFTEFSLREVLSVPVPVLIAIGVAIVLWVFLERTVLGQNIQAVGGNPVAANLAGISVAKSQSIGLVLSSLGAGAGGILLASSLGSGQTTAGDGYLLSCFAAAFLGSVAMRDGEFHIIGTIIGVITVGVGFSGLAVLGTATYSQYFFNGGLLVTAMALSTVARRLVAR